MKQRKPKEYNANHVAHTAECAFQRAIIQGEISIVNNEKIEWIDLIGMDSNGNYVLCELKFRKKGDNGNPLEATEQLKAYYENIKKNAKELNRIKQAQVQENMKFEKYNGEQMTFQDVITLANLAHDYNDRKSDKHIAVICNGENLAEKSRTELSNKLKNITDNNEYKISNIEYYPDSDYAIIKTITIVQGKVERAY